MIHTQIPAPLDTIAAGAKTASSDAADAVGTALSSRPGRLVLSSAVDPDDPELLAAVNEVLRSGRALMESKISGLVPGGLGDLLPGS
jgi:hypothetical protein